MMKKIVFSVFIILALCIGFATAALASGRYEGEYDSSGNRNGYGVWTWTYEDNNGVAQYEGQWSDGAPNGLGTLYYSPGSRVQQGDHDNLIESTLTGTFVDGYAHGPVTYIYYLESGNVYTWNFDVDMGVSTVSEVTATASTTLFSPVLYMDWDLGVSPWIDGVMPEETLPESDIPNAHPGPSPYSIIPDPERESDGFIGEWNADTGRFEITGLPGDVTDQIMYMDAPFELFHSFYINGIMQERDVHYTVEEGSTRVTVVAQTITDLENGDHTAEAAFSRTDGSGLLDIVAQDFTVNLTRPAAAGIDGGQPGAQPLAVDGQIPAVQQSAPTRNGNILPLVIGIAAVMLAGGGILYVVIRNKKKNS